MPNQLAQLAAHIVGAYAENNPVAPSTLPDLIANVAASLAKLVQPAKPSAPALISTG